MKFTGELLLEVAMTVSTAYENWNVFTIMDFSALIVINYIDLYYCQTLKDDLKKRIVREQYKMPIVNKEIKEENMNFHLSVSRVSHAFFVWFYEHVYFHFWPYIGLFFSVVYVKHY